MPCTAHKLKIPQTSPTSCPTHIAPPSPTHTPTTQTPPPPHTHLPSPPPPPCQVSVCCPGAALPALHAALGTWAQAIRRSLGTLVVRQHTQKHRWGRRGVKEECGECSSGLCNRVGAALGARVLSINSRASQCHAQCSVCSRHFPFPACDLRVHKLPTPPHPTNVPPTMPLHPPNPPPPPCLPRF
jgi:hypothetical protein